MTTELAISITAIILAILSFGLSLYVVLRDRSNLITESQAYQHQESGEYYCLYFKVVNSGRRPIVLTMIEGVYEENHTCGEFIDHENKGIKLEEGEFYEHRFGKYDGIMVCDPLEQSEFFNIIDLRIVDSAGNKYGIKNAKENIRKITASKHPIGMR